MAASARGLSSWWRNLTRTDVGDDDRNSPFRDDLFSEINERRRAQQSSSRQRTGSSYAQPSDDSEQSLCQSCARLDLESLFRPIALPGANDGTSDDHHPRIVIDNITACDLCKFIRSICADLDRPTDHVFTLKRIAAHNALGYELGDILRPLEIATYLDVAIRLREGATEADSEPSLRRMDHYDRRLGILLALDTNSPASLSPLLSMCRAPEKIDFVRLKNWLTHCDTRHNTCGVPVTRPGETFDTTHFRLLNVETGLIVPANLTYRYVTLSYTLSDSIRPAMLPVKENIEMHHKLPKTISDAIKITRELGLRYLWVDILCIGCGDEAHQQIEAMHLIFARAYLTVVAACTPEDGLIGINKIGRRGRYERSLKLKNFKLIAHIEGGDSVDESRWNSRGWTMQEALFSRRCLFVCSDEVFLLCREYVYREFTLDNDRDISVQLPSRGPGTYGYRGILPMQLKIPRVWDYTFYCRIVDMYCSRHLSFDKDALEAFAGISRHIEQLSGSDILFGVPKRDFIAALCWQARQASSSSPSSQRNVPHSMVPTWSWMRQKSGAYFLTVASDAANDMQLESVIDTVGTTHQDAKSARVVRFPSTADAESSTVLLDTWTTECELEIDTEKSHVCGLFSKKNRIPVLYSSAPLDGQFDTISYKDFEMIPDVENRSRGPATLLFLRDVNLEYYKVDGNTKSMVALVVKLDKDVAYRISILVIHSTDWKNLQTKRIKIRLG